MRLGVIGVGLMGEQHLKALSLVPEIEVVAVADADPARARSVAERYGVDRVEAGVEALAGADDVDAVAVAVPPAAMIDVVPIVCAHGRSVLCEKPLGVDAGEARALLDVATAAGVVHALCRQRRYDPVHRYVRDLVAQGFIGAPLLVAVQVMTGWGRDAATGPGRQWVRQRAAGGGLLLQVLSHYIDLLRFTFGDFDVTFCDATPEDADDTVLLAGTFPNGGRVSLAASWLLHHPTGVTWQIHGTEGTIEITPELRILGGLRGRDVEDRGLDPAHLAGVGGELFPPYGERTAFGWGENAPMLAALASEFARRVTGTLETEPVYATFADGLRVLEAIDA